MCQFVLEGKKKIILLFSLFLLLFINLTILFNTIYRSYSIILTNFYFFFTIFLIIIFQFKKNKLYLNKYTQHIFSFTPNRTPI